MPNDNTVPIITSGDYKIKPGDQQNLQTFLSEVPVKVRPSSVVVVDPQKWSDVSKGMSLEPTGVAFTVGDRVYLNGASLNPSEDDVRKFQSDLGEGGDLSTYALSHELAHMQDTQHPRQWQEAHDSIYNSNGKKIYASWQKSQKAQRDQNAQMEKMAHDTKFGILERYFSNPQLETTPYSLARQLRP